MSLLSFDVLGDEVALGNYAGFALAFHKRNVDGTTSPVCELLRTSDDYDATIDAAMPAGLGAGTYTITVEGMTDDDYQKLANQQDSEPDALRIVRLYLYWRDANASVGGYLANLAGIGSLLPGPSAADLEKFLVAELCISSVSRKPGARRYDAILVARESVWAALDRGLHSPVAGSFEDALKLVSQQLGVTMKTHLDDLPAAGVGPAPGTDDASVPRGTYGHACLHKLGQKLELATENYGRGMYLIRKGELHVGSRPIPLEGKPKVLDLGGGLVEVLELDPVTRDPQAGSGDMAPTFQPSRRQWKVTLKGRPDLFPGDVVQFDPPPDDASTTPKLGAALLGPLAGPLTAAMGGGEPSTSAYVSSVHHRMGRATGFVTEVTCVHLESGDTGWDEHTKQPTTPPVTAGKPAGSAASPLESVVSGLERLMAQALELLAWADVAEVRDHTTDAGSDPTTEPPSQSVTLFHGATAGDGRGRGARRHEIDREHPLEMAGVPYVTPFAWGNCGLVLPRYPGTRIVTLPRHADHDDRVDVGALWETGAAPASKVGDWWLKLPVGAPTTAPAGSDAPDTKVDKVSNDLIDADGNRCIDVGRLRIRVGPSKLPGPDERPETTEAEYVAIEHSDGKTRIVIDSDGQITIHAAKNLVLESEADIEMKAKNVNVSVQTAMNVK